ncbi:MAG: glycine cleavage T C-terminal barrel domain-containing protein [Nocardioides sp.]
MHTLGRPPRRLTLLHLDGSVDELPPHGAAVTLEDRIVGYVGSAARHHELGPIALALVKRSVLSDDGLLAGGGRRPGGRRRSRGRPVRPALPALTLQNVASFCRIGLKFCRIGLGASAGSARVR